MAAAAVLAAIWLVLRVIAKRARRVAGDSMRPTLAPGDLVLVRPHARPRRGDVVVVPDPRDPARETVKRVVAEGGDVVDLPGGPGRVPPGHIAVRGDNPLRSTDSRTYGTLSRRAVVGRVSARLWPHPGLLPPLRGATRAICPKSPHRPLSDD